MTATSFEPNPATAPTDVGWRISQAFADRSLDLSSRPVTAQEQGWDAMPEAKFARALSEAGADGPAIRLGLTFLAAMDRARDANALWKRGTELYQKSAWTFDPEVVAARTFGELVRTLADTGVSQRHLADAAAWRLIAESLTAEQASAVRQVIYEGRGKADELVDELGLRPNRGPGRFPFLSGPKVGPMWIRMQAWPGDARIERIEIIPVAVDVQVRKVAQYLGVTTVDPHAALSAVRSVIQEDWSRQVLAQRAVGPGRLSGTAVGLDPAVWFFGRIGCTYCERVRHKVPIHDVCRSFCRFEQLHPPGD